MNQSKVAAALACLMIAAACGGDEAGSGTTSSPVVTSTVASPTSVSSLPGGAGGCTVDVTGDLETSWQGPDDISAFTTDYWYTDDELQQTFEFLGDPAGGTFEEIMAAGGQVFTLFLFNCQGPNGELVTLSLSTDATRADVPFGPGTYAITGDLFGALGTGPANFGMIFATTDEDVWGIESAGSLTISEWSHSRLVGSFTFGAAERFVTPARTVSVSGSFEVTCQASVSC